MSAFLENGTHGKMESTWKIAYLVTLCIYFLQYSTNFLIYTLRSSDYRKACVYLLREIKDFSLNLADIMNNTDETVPYTISGDAYLSNFVTRCHLCDISSPYLGKSIVSYNQKKNVRRDNQR